MNAATMFAWWGFNLWIPAYLSLPVDRGGMGLSTATMANFVVVMQVGMWLGYVTFGFVSDALGPQADLHRLPAGGGGLMWAYAVTRDATTLLVLGPFVAFFGTGYFSGFGAITAELYPTAVRATAQGVHLQHWSDRQRRWRPSSSARWPPRAASAWRCRWRRSAFLVAAVLWMWIPETRGRALD